MKSLNPKSCIVDMFKDKDKRGKLESLSFLTLWISVVLVVVGISVGTFVSGIPVLMAVVGSFLALVSIILYMVAELWKGLRL